MSLDIQQFKRQWLMLRKLAARGAAWTQQQLADEYAVSTKTIGRDLQALADVGFPLHETTGPHGIKSWRIETDSILAGLTFTIDEVAALYLGRRFLEPLAGTYIFDAAQRAYQKIQAGFTRSALKYLGTLQAALHQTAIGASDYSQRGEIIDRLLVGIEDLKVCRLTYHSLNADSPADCDVHPYGLVHHHGSLYLVAHAVERGELRHYKIDRVHAVEVLTEKFARPADFDLSTHVNESFGIFGPTQEKQQVRIRFAPSTARYIQEHHWHPTQKIVESPDGSVILELTLADLTEIRAWVMSFGSKAVVEEPAELRRMVREEVAGLTAAYGEGDGNE
jgi:predicted DNA-binding transcriptional regulator YafY